MNKGLKQFKSELKNRKEFSGYVPVTMDELMIRFIQKFNRNEHIETYNRNKEILEKDNLKGKPDHEISEGVEKTLKSI